MRRVLRRSYPDARAVAQFVDAVEGVDDDQTRVELADQRLVEMLDHPEVDLSIDGQTVRVGKAAAQSAADQPVEREGGSAEIVGAAERSRHALVVIEKHPMAVDEGQFVGIEIELRRTDLLA